MNPIVMMMKRYIKMPLKYALPLLFICALVLSATTGCVGNSNPTATPTATPMVTATATVKATATPAKEVPTAAPTAAPTLRVWI